jgi:hypothetical protein
MSGTILGTYYHDVLRFWCSFFRKTIIYVNCSERHSLRTLIIKVWVNFFSFKWFVQRRQLLLFLTVRELWTFPSFAWLSALCWSNTRRGLECLAYVFLVRKVLNSYLVPDLLLWNIAWRTCNNTQPGMNVNRQCSLKYIRKKSTT